jgi:hypothetical protein
MQAPGTPVFRLNVAIGRVPVTAFTYVLLD